MGIEMIYISQLWLAILLSAVAVWVASSLIWMVMPHHKSDFKKLPDEDAAMKTLRAQDLAPGLYIMPHCKSWDDAKKPEVIEKMTNGPVGYLTVAPNGVPNMGKNVALSFLYYLVVGVIVAYVASRTVPASADYLAVFRVAGVVSWLAYGMGAIPDAIWFSRPWSQVIKLQFDSLVYALLTAGVFGWQWVSMSS